MQVNSGTWLTGDIGKNGADNFTGTINVQGGVLSFTGARYLNAGNINVSGGALEVTAVGSGLNNGGKFSLGSVGTNGTANLNLSGSGFIDLAQANLGNSIGPPSAPCSIRVAAHFRTV